jgi:predicted metal-dependent hydrolase
VYDTALLTQTCDEPISRLAIQGIELFNRGEYFEAHEVLEEAWKEDKTAGRDLYRSILQVAVAYYQIERGNYVGAMKMFLRVRRWIDQLPGLCRGVQVERLRRDAARVRQRLFELGPDNIGAFETKLFKPVIYDPFR